MSPLGGVPVVHRAGHRRPLRGGQHRPVRDVGQGTAELAILLPVLIMVVLAVIQIGLVSRDYVVLHHAAREAARQAAVDPRPAGAVAGARRASPVLDPDRLAVALTGGGSAGDLLTVEVDYLSPTRVPVVGRLIGDVEMSTTAVVRVE